MTINECIRDERKKCGMTQRQLSAKTGISRESIAKIETTQSDIPFRKLKLYANAFNLTLKELIEGVE